MIEEYKDIQAQFDKVIKYSQGLDHVHTDDLFNQWYENKKYFIEKLGGLIWESPDVVSFHLVDADKQHKIDDFINSVVLYRFNLYGLARFLNTERDGFFDNSVTQEYHTDDDITIPAGMKLLRAFKYFVDDENIVDTLQTTASRLIQEDKIEGHFCISVHPLDFISSSENQYNWRSCHALDGEFRAGNLSYMADASTVICYIKGEHDVKLPDFPPDVLWNNKKWRMWLYLADEHNALMAGRPYPFTIANVLDYARSVLFEKLDFKEYRWSKWHHDILQQYSFTDGTEEIIRCNDLLIVNGNFVSRYDLVTDAGCLHYNDLLKSSFYTPWYCWRVTTREKIHFTIGAPVNCLYCGQAHEITCPDAMTCASCYDAGTDAYEYCTCCDERHRREDMYWVNGEWVCADCFDKNCVVCADCGENVWRDDAYYDEDRGNWYCYRHAPDRPITTRTFF